MVTRVLHLIPNLGPGGAERLVLDLIKHTSSNVESGLCIMFDNQYEALDEEIKLLGIPVWRLGKRKGLDPRMPARIASIIRQFRPNVVHTHRYVLKYSLIPEVLLSVPVRVHTLHNIPSREVDKIGRLVNFSAFRMRLVYPVAISKTLAIETRRYYRLRFTPTFIVNGVDTRRFIGQKRQNSIWPLDVGNDARVILHVGRFEEQKNHRLLIYAFARVVSQLPFTHLVLIGDGPLRHEIMGLTRSLRLSERVHFLGLRTDIPDLMTAADVLVLSSSWEGVPLVVLEAMASGLPVVSTSVGGIPDLIEHEVTGLLVSPGNTDELTRNIIRVLTLPQQDYFAIAGAARRVAREKFDVSVTAATYEKLYNHLLEYGFPYPDWSMVHES